MKNDFVKLSYSTLSRKFTKEEIIPSEYELNGRVQVDVVKNEYECFQLALSAKKDCCYTVKVSEFSDGNGHTIPSDCVKVFNARFSKMWHCLDYKGNYSGSYPDPLIPFDASVNHNENRVKKGENAVLVVECNILSTQSAGEYKGKITIFTPDPIEVEVLINVLDICLPNGSEIHSLFFFNPKYAEYFEKSDDFVKTYDKYLDFAIKHRVGSTTLAVKHDYSDDGIRAYVDRIYDYAKKGMPFTNVPTYPRTFLKTREMFDRQILIKFLIALANKCISVNENFLDKVGFYNWCIDEPFCLDPQGDLYNGYVENEIYAFFDCVNKVVNRLSSDPNFKTPFGEEIINSIKDFRQIVTDYYDFKPHTPNFVPIGKNGKRYIHDPKKVVLCPKFDGLDTPEHRKPYEGAEVWWYNCGEPNSPFPTYHVDESGYGPRVLTWMMREYGIVGNLYWACNNIMELFDDGTSRYTDDPYRILNGLGDSNEGLIVFPGHPYGVDGPIDSWRFVAIRDGQEDYELIGMLKREYEKLGSNYLGIFKVITSRLYNNARINYFSTEFDGARKNLLSLMMLAKKGVSIEVLDGGSNYTFKLKGNYDEATFNGVNYFSSNYTVVKQPKNSILKIIIDGAIYTVNLYLGVGLQIINDYELKEHATISGNVDISYDIREVIYHTIIKMKDKNGVTFTFNDNLSNASSFSMSCLLKSASKYKVISGGKIISEGQFVCEDTVYGTANRVNLNPKEIVESKFTVVLEDIDTFGIRETYIYK